MTTAATFSEGILEALGRAPLRDTDAHLDALLLHLGSGPYAALLWLYDPAREALVLERARTIGLTEPSPETALRYVRLEGVTPASLSRATASSRLTEHSRVREWAGACTLSRSHAAVVPAIATDARGVDAVLQILSSRELSRDETLAIDAIAARLGTELARERATRHRDTMDDLLTRLIPGRAVEEWLGDAAGSLAEATEATACAILTPQPDLTLKVVAAFPRKRPMPLLIAPRKSLCARIASLGRVGRLRDFSDASERQEVLGTTEFDGRLVNGLSHHYLLRSDLRSAMAGPVTLGGHALAVVLLLNKRSSLAGEFTAADEALLTAVLALLKSIIPSARIYDIVSDISQTNTWSFQDDPIGRKALFDLLRSAVPGLLSATIERAASDSPSNEPILIGSIDIRDSDLAPQAEYRHWIPDSDPPATLVLTLARTGLTAYEKRAVRFFGRQLAQILQLAKHKWNEAEAFVHLQHLVKTGLNGTSGYLAEIASGYEVFRRNGDVRALSLARFHKALQRSRFYARYVQTLIDQNRYLTGQMLAENLKAAPCSLHALVVDIVQVMRPAADQRELTVEFNDSHPEESASVTIDRGWVEVVVFNLLDNAIKYSYRNHAITVSLYPERLHSRPQLILAVQNHGVPIKESDREKIFEPFVRRPTDPNAPLRPGTGLGLAIARRVAYLHGGEIQFTSTVRGTTDLIADTTFYLRLPKRREVDA